MIIIQFTLSDFGDGKRGSVGGEDGVTRGGFVQRLEQFLLDAEVLNDGFDDDVGGGGSGHRVRRRRDLPQRLGHEGFALSRIRRKFLLYDAAQAFPDAVLFFDGFA